MRGGEEIREPRGDGAETENVARGELRALHGAGARGGIGEQSRREIAQIRWLAAMPIFIFKSEALGGSVAADAGDSAQEGVACDLAGDGARSS